ncbi:acyltransferase family protein [Chelativorans sp. AA-79]|uniref:acyltransferase family protein n=1 Tax=Chelativorans sp. AA-79 TaxID=3028735 RepID=UPI0023F69927|nr:acyltransferase family protein [Chelativorans sp. AA-79]WEX11613.1 acyltransferase family protein [Chelativorans sp. AA-79]
MKYRADIDGLRAVAVIPVVLFHAGLSQFSGGFVGVDVFFVISGYVISQSLLGDIARGEFSILNFYARRVRRIFPALFAVMIATFIYAYFVLLPSHFAAFSESLLAAATFVSNIYFWKDSGYFAAEAVYRPLLHTWSLSVEEQFYIFMPVAVYLVARFFGSRWLVVFLPVLLVSLALSIYAMGTAPTANFYLLPTRAWELLVGALLALAPPPPMRSRAANEVIAALGLALILFAVFAFDESTPFPGYNALYPCLGSALLIYAGTGAGSLVTSLLSMRLLVAVGLISYSLYLIHWPIVVFVNYQSLASPTLPQTAGIVAASVLLAAFSWRYIEQPFRRPAPHLTRPRLLTGGVAAIAVFATLGAIGARAQGFPGRFPDFAEQKIAGNEQWRLKDCFRINDINARPWDAKACTLTSGGTRKVLLWGDSFAAQYVPGIVGNADRIDATVIQYTGPGCPPVLSYMSYGRPLCKDFNAKALEFIEKEGVDAVILGARWTDLQSRGLEELRSTLDALKKMGREVYILGQSPEFSMDVQVIAYMQGSRDPAALDRWDVFFDPEINDELQGLAEGAVFINPMAELCAGRSCVYRDKGVFLFEDYGHFSAEGAKRAVEAYFPFMDPSRKAIATEGGTKS